MQACAIGAAKEENVHGGGLCAGCPLLFLAARPYGLDELTTTDTNQVRIVNVVTSARLLLTPVTFLVWSATTEDLAGGEAKTLLWPARSSRGGADAVRDAASLTWCGHSGLGGLDNRSVPPTSRSACASRLIAALLPSRTVSSTPVEAGWPRPTLISLFAPTRASVRDGRPREEFTQPPVA